MTATSGRLLKLLSLLQTRRDWPGEELARRLEVSGRTIRRDIERLRELGYPVDALTGPAGGYRLHAGTAMPPLLLDDDEAVAIAVGLRTAARASVTGIEETSVRALVKLEQVLPSHLRRRVNALQTATVTLAASGPDGRPRDPHGHRRRQPRSRAPALRLPRPRRDREPPVRRAAHARQPRPALVPRGVGLRPRGLAHLPRRPPRAPVAGGDALRAARAAHPDAAAYVAANLSGAPSRYQARVTLHAPAEEVAERSLFTGCSVEAIDERTCELRTSDDSLDWLAVRVAMLGVDFEVHEPPMSSWSAFASWRRGSSERRAPRRGDGPQPGGPAAGGGRVLSADTASDSASSV